MTRRYAGWTEAAGANGGVRVPVRRMRETEHAFQQAVIELAQTLGWRVYHARPARTAHGWRTAMQGHDGWPDVVLCRRGRLIIAELKSAKGRLTPGQLAWIEALRECAGIHVALWRPEDWDAIVAILTGGSVDR